MAATFAGCASRPTVAPAVREPALGLTHELTNSSTESTKTAQVQSATTTLTVSHQPWTFASEQGQLISTANYRLYTTVANQDFLDRLPAFYELALEHYTTALATLPKPDAPLETFLFKNRDQWQLKTQEMLPEQSKLFSSLGRGGFTTRGTSVLYYIDRWGFPRDTFAIAAHEGWHQYSQQTFKHQLPIWLEEGVATYMEGYRMNRQTGVPDFQPAANFERRQTLVEAFRTHHLIPLDDLLTRAPQSFLNESKDSLLTYYAQVWALTRFLAEGADGRYKPALADVLTDAAQGRLVGRMMASPVTAGMRRRGSSVNRVGPAVAQEYFNKDLAAFEVEYLAFIDEIVQPKQTH